MPIIKKKVVFLQVQISDETSEEQFSNLFITPAIVVGDAVGVPKSRYNEA